MKFKNLEPFSRKGSDISSMSKKSSFTASCLVLIVALFISFSVPASAQVEIEQGGAPVNPLIFDDLVSLSSELLNTFWDEVFYSQGLTYQLPSGFFWYNEEIPSNCGPTALMNAFFCPADATIWFHYDFLLMLYNQIGDYAAAHVLAHEWAHFIQHLLGINNNGFTIFTELQADCFAGFFAAWADDNGYLDEGDIDEAVTITYHIGDPETMPWYEPGAHGTSSQRITAFGLGLEQGLFSCSFENITLIIEGYTLNSFNDAQPVNAPQINALTITPLTHGGNAYGLDIRANSADVQAITLEVFDTAGNRVYEDTSHSGALRFHGLSNNGQRLSNGVYLYVVTTRKLDGSITRSEVRKLVIVR